MKLSLTTLLTAAALLLCAFAAAAQDEYVVVGAASDVYEESELTTPVINQWANHDRVQPGMAFKVMQKMDGAYSLEFPGWSGAWIPAKACAAPDEVNPAPGTYTFPIEDGETYTATLSEQRPDGTWQVTVRGGATDTARRVSPTLILIYNDTTQMPEGSITSVGGKTYLYIYDTMLLGWD